ncbi:hypothetical protein, partial [Stenotrophomonas maltophilia]|uniref:hypothetical protein n=1 Tax=Stenotrophomonas maltophilia TaxID=40324 RepID=UPI001954D8C2
DRLGAEKALERLSRAQLDFMVPVLGAWLAFDRGRDPSPLLDTARGNPLAARFADRNRALLLIASAMGVMLPMVLKPPEVGTFFLAQIAIATGAVAAQAGLT